MRLSKQTVRTIKQKTHEIDPQAKIYLFGSRVDDSLRGGDIDLLILSQIIDSSLKRQLKLKLYDELGEQKIDIIVTDMPRTVFETMAIKEGILL